MKLVEITLTDKGISYKTGKAPAELILTGLTQALVDIALEVGGDPEKSKYEILDIISDAIDEAQKNHT